MVARTMDGASALRPAPIWTPGSVSVRYRRSAPVTAMGCVPLARSCSTATCISSIRPMAIKPMTPSATPSPQMASAFSPIAPTQSSRLLETWTCGRAIDADVIAHDGLLFLYFSTRDPDMRIQMTGVATAPLALDFSRDTWIQRCDAPILSPELAWEGECIEASALCRHDGKFYMFMLARTIIGRNRLGVPSASTASDGRGFPINPSFQTARQARGIAASSGHPYVFEAADGTYHLFFQGNNDQGRTWYLSRTIIRWHDGFPSIDEPTS